MKLQKKQRLIIIATVTILLLVSLFHLIILKKINYNKDIIQRCNRLSEAYLSNGIEGVKGEIRNIFDSAKDYRSSDAYNKFFENTIKINEGGFLPEMQKMCEVQHKEMDNSRQQQFYVNILLLSIFIVGFASVVIAGIK
jgi:hypothetical protein